MLPTSSTCRAWAGPGTMANVNATSKAGALPSGESPAATYPDVDPGRGGEQQQRRRLRHSGHDYQIPWAVEFLAVDKSGVDGRPGRGVVVADRVVARVGYKEMVLPSALDRPVR